MRPLPVPNMFVVGPRRPVHNPDRGVECEIVLELKQQRLGLARARCKTTIAVLKIAALKAGWGETEVMRAFEDIAARHQ